MTTRWPVMKASLSTHNELCVYSLPHRLLHAKISIAQILQSESIKHFFSIKPIKPIKIYLHHIIANRFMLIRSELEFSSISHIVTIFKISAILRRFMPKFRLFVLRELWQSIKYLDETMVLNIHIYISISFKLQLPLVFWISLVENINILKWRHLEGSDNNAHICSRTDLAFMSDSPIYNQDTCKSL